MRGRNYKHGAACVGEKTPEYRIWCAMRERCNYDKHVEYGRYGGRGITVCQRWDSFANFLADMGRRPPGAYSIDRIDSNGHYAPANCRWATPIEQARNKRTSIILTLNGETHHVLDWAKKLNLSLNTIRKRLRNTRDAAQVLRPSRQAPRIST